MLTMEQLKELPDSVKNSAVKTRNYVTGQGRSIGIAKESFESMKKRAVNAQFDDIGVLK